MRLILSITYAQINNARKLTASLRGRVAPVTDRQSQNRCPAAGVRGVREPRAPLCKTGVRGAPRLDLYFPRELGHLPGGSRLMPRGKCKLCLKGNDLQNSRF